MLLPQFINLKHILNMWGGGGGGFKKWRPDYLLGFNSKVSKATQTHSKQFSKQ